MSWTVKDVIILALWFIQNQTVIHLGKKNLKKHVQLIVMTFYKPTNYVN